MRKQIADEPLQTSLTYGLAGLLWMLLANLVLQASIGDPRRADRLQVYTGWAFVLFSTIMLYALLRANQRRQQAEMRGREQADAELREHQRKLATVLDLLPVGVAILNDSRAALYVNPAQERLVEQTSANLLDDRYLSIHFVNAAGEALQTDSFASVRAIREQRPILHETTGIVRADGSIIWLDVSAIPVDFPDWNVVTVISDLSGRRRDEAQLREQASLLDQVSDAIISVDSGFVIKSWNAAAEALYGWPASAAIGQLLPALVPTEYLDSDAQRSFADVTERGAWEGEVVQRHRNGEARTILSSVRVLRNGGGQAAGLVAVNRDFTQRRRAETVLRQFEQRFATAFHSSPAAMLITRASDGTFIDVNASYQQLFGFTRDELLGQTGTALGIYTSAEQRAETVRLLREQGRLRDFEMVLRTRSGDLRNVLCSLEHIEIDGEACLLGTMVDVTERARAESALRRSVARLQLLADASRAFTEAGIHSQSLLELIARQVVGSLGDFCLIRVLSDDANSLDVAARAYYDPADHHMASYLESMTASLAIALDQGGLHAQTFHSGSAVLMPTVDLEALRQELAPPLWEAFVQVKLHSLLMVAIRYQGHSSGLMTVWRFRPEQPPFDEDDLQLAQELVNRAATALQNARLFEEVSAARERLRALSRRLVEVQEAERRSVARELHDEIGQLLTGLNMILEAGPHISHSPLVERLSEAQAMVNELTGRVRQLSLDLRPLMLDDLGLVPALLWLFTRYTAQNQVEVAFKHASMERRFAANIEIAAYRIVQEALTNIARYARVHEASVYVWSTEELLGVQIEDHGAGFTLAGLHEQYISSGIAGMRERARLLGGDLIIETAPGAGTAIFASLPLTP